MFLENENPDFVLLAEIAGAERFLPYEIPSFIRLRFDKPHMIAPARHDLMTDVDRLVTFAQQLIEQFVTIRPLVNTRKVYGRRQRR